MHALAQHLAFVFSFFFLICALLFMVIFIGTFTRVAHIVRLRMFRGFVVTGFVGVMLLLYSGFIKW